jgi:methylmalonyl-CoA mutase N-terminal domain/subunit
MKQSSDRRDPDAPALAAQLDAWEKNEVASFLARQPERQPEFRTLGGLPLKRVYTPLDLADTPPADLGLPGQYPYTRGPYPTMYRGRLWTMRQIAGFGTAEDTNGRFKYLIGQGQTGLSTDFDMPTLMGYDSDHPLCEGEVGREGVAVDTLADVEHLFDGIDLERISVSMTINPTAWILLAMYVALAQKRGCDLNRLSGTIQADILKEFQAQKEWIFPIAPSVRIVRDCITWCARNMKRYNPINISGYHISEAGSSPLDEAAFTMCNLVTYVDAVTKTGMHVDEFAPRLAFYYVAQADFFEEIAKLRAVRRVYAKIMRERFGARNPESMRLRFHCQTAAASLTRPQPQINIVRTGLQALAAVLGGAQSLHTNGMDEAFAIPTEEHAADHRRGKRCRQRRRSARRLVFRREPDHGVRARHLRGAGRGRAPGRHHQDDRGGMVPATNCRLRLRHGQTQGERRETGDRRQQICRTGRAIRRRDPPLRPDHRRTPDRAPRTRAARARRGESKRVARPPRSRRGG